MLDQLDQFTFAYIECLLWSEIDDNEEPLDKNYMVEDIDPQTLREIVEDCQSFQDEHRSMIEGKEERAGHDFCLTRNHHGAGFWDGDWPDDEDEILTSSSHSYGELNLYVGDDGLLST